MTNHSKNPLRTTFAWCWLAVTGILSCGLEQSQEKNSQASEKAENGAFRILILGDSLTEGYGVPEGDAYPALLETKLNRELAPETGLRYEVVNGGISGATTSGGVSRIEWFLRSRPDFMVLALGGNDGLRGIPVPEMKKNLALILRAADENKIPTLLAGMKMPPNYGLSYAESYAKAFQEVAGQFEVPLIPFLLDGVGGLPEMNLPDRIHPNSRGHRVICETVYKALSPALYSNEP